MADVLFTSYQFSAAAPAANGHTTKRTMPVRYNDVINVKDFGATGNGSTDDSGAINAAIVYSYTLFRNPGGSGNVKGGTLIYFPPGVYQITANFIEIACQADAQGSGWIELIGASRNSTVMRGTYSTGFLVQSNPPGSSGLGCGGIRNLSIQNLSTNTSSGGLIFRNLINNNTRVENCDFVGYRGLMVVGDTELSTSTRNCRFSYPGFTDGGNFYPANAGGPASKSIGCGMRGGVCIANYSEGFDHGFIFDGHGMVAQGNKAYRCNRGMTIVWPQALDIFFAAVQKSPPISGNSFERCVAGIFHAAIDLQGPGSLAGATVLANDFSGIESATDPAAISGITWSGGTAEVTTSVNHNLSGTIKLLIRTSPVDWTPNMIGQQQLSCTVTAVNKFTYSLTGAGSGSPTGSWNYIPDSGIYVRSCQYCAFLANSLRVSVNSSSFYIADNAEGTQGDSRTNVVMATSAPYGFVLPAQPLDSANWTFIQCGTVGQTVPYGYMTYASLAYGALEGRAYDIVDAQTQASFAGTVSGGSSSNHYKVRYNGSAWTRVG